MSQWPMFKLGSQNHMKGEKQKMGNEEYISGSVKGTWGGIKIVFFETRDRTFAIMCMYFGFDLML